MSCLCQDRFKQTTADTVEEKPPVRGFLPRSSQRFDWAMPLWQRFGWARRVSSG